MRRFAQVDFLPVEADAAAPGDHRSLILEWIDRQIAGCLRRGDTTARAVRRRRDRSGVGTVLIGMVGGATVSGACIPLINRAPQRSLAESTVETVVCSLILRAAGELVLGEPRRDRRRHTRLPAPGVQQIVVSGREKSQAEEISRTASHHSGRDGIDGRDDSFAYLFCPA